MDYTPTCRRCGARVRYAEQADGPPVSLDEAADGDVRLVWEELSNSKHTLLVADGPGPFRRHICEPVLAHA